MTQMYDDREHEHLMIKDDGDGELSDCKKRASSATKLNKKKQINDIEIDLISNLAESVLRDRKYKRKTVDRFPPAHPPLNTSSLAAELKDHSFYGFQGRRMQQNVPFGTLYETASGALQFFDNVTPKNSNRNIHGYFFGGDASACSYVEASHSLFNSNLDFTQYNRDSSTQKRRSSQYTPL